MASEPYLLDSTVIINLAYVDKPVPAQIVEALAEIAIVALEVDDELYDGVMSSRRHPRAAEARSIGKQMRQGPDEDFPLIERGDELREEIGKPSDPAGKHSGEAGSAALAERLGGTLVTDDRSGKDLERLTSVNLLTTAGLLAELVDRGAVTCADAQSAYADIIAADRWVDPDATIC